LILTAYFDESGTHGGSPSTVMAGVLGTPEQWGNFRRELALLKIAYGFSKFHTKEFRARSGAFAGWTPEKCFLLAMEFARLTSQVKFVDSVEFLLDNHDFDKQYKGRSNDKKLSLYSKYGMCFRQCLLYFILSVVDRFKNDVRRTDLSINVTIEDGHKNAGAALDIFNETRKDLDKFDLSSLLGHLRFATKEQNEELMLPDFLSYMALHMDRLSRSGKYTRAPPLQVGGMFPHNWGRANDDITHLEFRRGGLADVRKELEMKLQMRRAQWSSKRGNPASEDEGCGE
jgi:uncharacterized protein DUF3800